MGDLANDYANLGCGNRQSGFITCPWQDNLIDSYVL